MENETKIKIPKTRLVFVVKGNYGTKYEDVTQETSYYAGRNRLKEYQENEPYSFKLIKRRVPYFELTEHEKRINQQEKENYMNRRTK